MGDHKLSCWSCATRVQCSYWIDRKPINVCFTIRINISVFISCILLLALDEKSMWMQIVPFEIMRIDSIRRSLTPMLNRMSISFQFASCSAPKHGHSGKNGTCFNWQYTKLPHRLLTSNTEGKNAHNFALNSICGQKIIEVKFSSGTPTTDDRHYFKFKALLILAVLFFNQFDNNVFNSKSSAFCHIQRMSTAQPMNFRNWAIPWMLMTFWTIFHICHVWI